MSNTDHSGESYDLRTYYLKGFKTRLVFLMGAAGGLLFLADSSLLCHWQKIVLIIWNFANIVVGYHALLGFEDAILNIEYLISGNLVNSSSKIIDEWPLKDEKRYRFVFGSTLIMAILIIIALIANCFFVKKPDEQKSVTSFKTSTVVYTIGPFVDGFDSLPDTAHYFKIKELKDSFATHRNYTEIEIFGGVDKRPLKNVSKQIFGDNITLAQSRAEWVKKEIINARMIKDSCFIFTGIQGAKSYLRTYSSNDYANSRYVTIRCRYMDSIITNITPAIKSD